MKFEDIQKEVLQYLEDHNLIRIILPFNMIFLVGSLIGLTLAQFKILLLGDLYTYFLVIFLISVLITAVKGDFKMVFLTLLIKLVLTILSTIFGFKGFLGFLFAICSILFYAYFTYEAYLKCKDYIDFGGKNE